MDRNGHVGESAASQTGPRHDESIMQRANWNIMLLCEGVTVATRKVRARSGLIRLATEIDRPV